jgi:hypothetical protein
MNSGIKQNGGKKAMHENNGLTMRIGITIVSRNK